MKRIINLGLLLCSYALLWAVENPKTLIVWAKDGSKVGYALSETPKVTFTNDYLVITTNSVEINYQLSEMTHFTYDNQEITTNIENGSITNPLIMNGDKLIFPAIDKNITITIYTIDGKTVSNYTVHLGSVFTLSLNEFSRGIYLVNIDGITYKISKK